MNGSNEMGRPTGMGTTRSDYEASTSPNRLESITGYPLPPSFSDVQLLEAQGMPRVASEATTACVMGVAMSQLGRWRREGTGPRCLTDRGGHPAYRRTDVLAFMRSHMDGGRS